MTVLRFQRAVGVTAAEISRQLPTGSFTSVSVPEPGHMVDVTVTAAGVTDATSFMTAQGYTLFATDPVPTLESASAGEVPPIDRMKLNDGTVLTVGAVTDGQLLARSGAGLVGMTSGAAFDPRDIVVFDHFVTSNLDPDEVGWLGWRTRIIGTGADLVTSPEAGRPGVLDFGAGTVAGGRAGMHLGEAAIPNWIINTTQGQILIEWLVKFNANAIVGANMERFTCGSGDAFDGAAGAEHTNGVYCEFDPAGSANFRLAVTNAASKVLTTTSIAVAATTWYRIGIRITYPGGTPTAELLINGTVRATSTAPFPSAGLALGIIMDANATASEARYQTDYALVQQVTSKET